MSLPLASLSLDLDNKWSYLKTHGDAGWEEFPTYLELVVPRVTQMLESLSLRITVFVVGQDAALAKNDTACGMLSETGHEIGNHSFRHEPWLHRYSESELVDELQRSEETLERQFGRRPRGFRGPGYSISATLLRLLCERGYEYDASTLPTFIGPLARAYYFLGSRLAREEKAERSKLFGTWRDGLRPVKPYLWQLESAELLELPVTTMPLLRTPFHFSYVLYLAQHSETLAHRYFRAALYACRVSGISPSVLLHPLDFLGREDDSDLGFFPGMQLPRQRKLDLLESLLTRYSQSFRVVDLSTHAREERAAAERRRRRRWQEMPPRDSSEVADRSPTRNSTNQAESKRSQAFTPGANHSASSRLR